MKLEICENSNDAVKIAAAARYLPITMSKSPAGSVSSNSSVPWRRSSDQMLIVIAGMKTSRIAGQVQVQLIEIGQVRREELVRPERGKRRQQHEQTEEHVAGRIAEVPDEVPLQHGERRVLVQDQRDQRQQQHTDEHKVNQQEIQQLSKYGHDFYLVVILSSDAMV